MLRESDTTLDRSLSVMYGNVPENTPGALRKMNLDNVDVQR
jgi:hypothetical protein